jgi:hypothetical protein
MIPQIVTESIGFHNSNPETRKRIEKSKSYQDLSTICIVPTRGMIHAKVVQNWLGLMAPMNQKFTRHFAIGMEVGAAYSEAIEMILQNPELSKWQYILFLEEDNLPPPDGLLKLYENMDKYDAIGGLYWTKGENGQPMCYGNPNVFPVNFIPFLPDVDQVTECRGLGMGFTLAKLSMFKDPRLPKPFFKTIQTYTPGKGVEAYTQDLKFFENAGKLGYKFACDSRVKVGHYDVNNDFVW